MNKKRNSIIFLAASVCMVGSPAHAQFGRIFGGGGGGGGAAADPDAFLAAAQVAEKLMNNSVALLARSLGSKEKVAELEARRKAANETTDPAEKQAKLTEVRKSEQALLNESMANANIESDVKNLDAKRKEDLGSAAFNFMLALMQDKALVEQGQSIVSSLASNPMNATKLGSVKNAISSLTNQVSSASQVAGKMPMIFSAVGVKAPASKDEKPKETKQVDGD